MSICFLIHEYIFELQTQILDLTDELELRKIREEELLRQQAMDSKHVIEEIEELRVSSILKSRELRFIESLSSSYRKTDRI